MKAMLLSEYKHLSITDMPEPAVDEHDVLVRVRACGICGSDVHGFDGSSGRRVPPLVMGHEAAGVVERVGAGVDGVSAGDRVTFDSTVSCGKCAPCRAGRINLCDRRRVLGVSCGDYRRHGAFAEYVAVPSHIVYKLPDALSFEHAAMIEAVSVAVHAVGRTPIKLGDTVAVIGVGMIGLLVIQAARLAGAGRILAVDIDDDRLALAKRLGADDTVNAKRSPGEVPRGVADACFEVVGASATVNTAIDALRKGGALTLIGNLAPTAELPLQKVVTRELTLIGSCASAGEYPACIELMSRGAIQVGPLISAVAPLDEGPAWFDRLYAREQGLMKVILTP